MCPTRYYQIMRNCKDKKAHRYQMVVYAQSNGVKPAARRYNTYPKVIRKWLRRFKTQGYKGLEDRSRRPFNMPNATSEGLKQRIIQLRKKYKRLGAEQVRIIENLDISAKTIRKIWRQAGVARKRRLKKYKVKQNLRHIKKQYKLFELVCEDTKHLYDIPEYYPYMKQYNLPRYQYTIREVSCGIKFLGFSNELSLTNSTLFAKYVNSFLDKHKLLPDKSIRQTDNGVEYIGAWNAKRVSSYTKEVESLKGQTHQTIPPRVYQLQGDVETVHNIIEQEFYELETFNSRDEFFNKSYSYQLFFNFQRPNTYKEGRTPWQLAKIKNPKLKEQALMLAPIDLDLAVKNYCSGGYNVLTNP